MSSVHCRKTVLSFAQLDLSPDLWVPCPPLLHQLFPPSLSLSQNFTSPYTEFFCSILQIYSSLPHPLKKCFESICYLESTFAFMKLLSFPLESKFMENLPNPEFTGPTISVFLPHGFISTRSHWVKRHHLSQTLGRYSSWFQEEKTNTKHDLYLDWGEASELWEYMIRSPD